ncbi:hypothetical protein ACFSX9_13210 [Flavobacterium ardleyense]|uniref:Uncharacterized protein n=1 Tax=Flavobacterium ardleyense TaxID=2038737 RepID=A0ABW5Z9Y9_9FLAO
MSVEKSIFGIQTGLLGIWIHNEYGLSNQIVLRSELGLDSGFFASSDEFTFLMTPVLTLESRWYYNLEKRNAKNKNIKNNSGNFLALKTSYNPDLFTISNAENVRVINQISIIPKWAIKRTYFDHLTFETGVGIGQVFYLGKSSQYLAKKSETVLDLHLRIGYTF